MNGIDSIVFLVFLVSVTFRFLLLVPKYIAFFYISAKTSVPIAQPPISILISARNEAKYLEVLVHTLMKQNYPCFEVIIALDRCTDDSMAKARALKKAYPHVHFIDIEQVPSSIHPKKYALTQAVHLAQYEWLVLTDADCLPLSDQWLQYLSRSMKPDKEIIVGFSPYHRRPGLLNAYIRFETFLTGINYLTAAHWGFPYMGVGRNLAYRKSLFFREGGFFPFESVQGG
ncbi:MAG: glycosyltransferase, partial [Cyclobacteriaceae bacterium]|nr:glycosyltransferase [Cyclobacteriaceae bacterium]